MYRQRRSLGLKGEELAAGYLARKGFRIIERNFKCQLGEIDIIARHAGYLVFVEVRTRSSTRYGLPQESVTGKKISRLRRLAQFYLTRGPWQGARVRFDVVAVTWSDEPEITHIENAF